MALSFPVTVHHAPITKRHACDPRANADADDHDHACCVRLDDATMLLVTRTHVKTIPLARGGRVRTSSSQFLLVSAPRQLWVERALDADAMDVIIAAGHVYVLATRASAPHSFRATGFAVYGHDVVHDAAGACIAHNKLIAAQAAALYVFSRVTGALHAVVTSSRFARLGSVVPVHTRSAAQCVAVADVGRRVIHVVDVTTGRVVRTASPDVIMHE
jgi:hypothetical protein